MTPHDPGVEAAIRRAAPLLEHPETRFSDRGPHIRIGTASWTDPTITKPGVFYPASAKNPEARLRFYASIFPVVEVDSSYYALPTRRVAELWVKRTPPDFLFNIKAYALMTAHPGELSRLPRTLQDELPADVRSKGRVYAKDLPDEIVAEIWNVFLDALVPLVEHHKLGAVMLQFPRWFVPSRKAADELRDARRRLGDLPASVEFRNARWFAPRLAERTFSLLQDLAFSYVCVDEPQGMPSSVPPVMRVTNPRLAIVRLHGHRGETWEKPGIPVVERYRYFYGRKELSEWATRTMELSEKATETHVIFNNCYANYGTTNALEIGQLISRIYRVGE